MNKALQEEERRLRMLRFVVDINHALLMQQTDLTLRESFDILKNTRQAAQNLFPGKDDVFELIYTPRFMRTIRERFLIAGGRSGKGPANIAPGTLRAELEKAGKPIGSMDMLIGAHARALGVTLVTNNTKEFKQIKNLKIVDWSV